MKESVETHTSPHESRYADAAGWYLRIRKAGIHGPELSATELLEWEKFFSDQDNRRAIDLAARVLSQVKQRHLDVDYASISTVEVEYHLSDAVRELLGRGAGKATFGPFAFQYRNLFHG